MMNDIIAWLNQIDTHLMLLLNGIGSENWDAFWLFITNKYSSVPLYVLLLLLCIYQKKWSGTLLIVVLTVLMILLTDQTANLFKYGFERLRPCHQPLINMSIRILHCGGKYGYFSAHAASSFALAILFGKIFYKKMPFLAVVLLAWASVVSFSRIYIGVHYPFDVLTGLVVGCLYGCVFYALHKKIYLKYFVAT